MPLPDDTKIISVDDHVIEHPNVWQDRLPQQYKEAGPKIVDFTGTTTDALGNVREGTMQTWEAEGRRAPTVGLNAVAGKPKEEIGLDPVRLDEMRPGCYDIKARLADMDEDGVHAQLCFPSYPGFAGSTFFNYEDKGLANACVTAWNDFILDEWCAEAPDRMIPMGLVPYWDVEAATAEVERIAAKGARAISFIEAPHAVGLPSFHSDHWDPMLAVLNEAEMPMCLHFGSGGGPVVAPDANFGVAIALFGTNSLFAMTELLLSPTFHKFPNLKVALSEGGIGWMPWMRERIDYVWERHRHYTGMNKDVRPSELFKDHIFGCFIFDQIGIQVRDEIGIDNIMFESDYPHSDSNWPHSRKMLAERLVDVPDEDARKIAELNARRLFNFHD
jgi:predicted TIM-barrel fold metal-dependent hydrolase